MKILTAFFFTLLLVSSAHAACARCGELKSVVAQVRSEMRKSSPEYGPLITKASMVSGSLPEKLSSEELEAYVEVLRAFFAVDPSNAFIENTLDIVQKNKAAIDAALSKIPKAEAKDLNLALQMALESMAHGQN